MDSVEITDETGKEAAAAAKAKGTSHFSKAEYADALAAYQEAASHDSTDHVFPSNICACYLELAKKEYEEAKKVDLNARAFLASQQCVKLNASWVKGHLRQATAEAERALGAEWFAMRGFDVLAMAVGGPLRRQGKK